MNRRDFLRARPVPTILEPDAALLRFSHAAMATVFELFLPWGTEHRVADAVFAEIDQIEAQLTVYRESSEVSRLNRIGAMAPVPLTDDLFNLLHLAAQIAEASGGAFDITAGPLIKAWGFYRRQGRVPDDQALAEAMSQVGMDKVEFDTQRRSVRFNCPGVEINLGSIGKGYALDRAGDLLRQRFGIQDALLSGGNSSVLAMGSPTGSTLGWPVGVRHPDRPNERVAVIRLRDRALATSGSTHQHFEYNNRKLGHVIDPRTGRPAEGIAMATAFAPAAAEADALSTAFYVLGVREAREYCQRHPDVSALLLPDEPDAGLERINLQPGDVRPASESIADHESNWELA